MSEYNIENMQKRMKEMDQLVADNLEQVCREILEWHDTAILPDGVFRKASSLLNGLTEHQHAIVEATANRKALKFVIDNTPVVEDFKKCFDMAQYLTSLFPEHSEMWRGSVSERIAKGIELLEAQRSLS